MTKTFLAAIALSVAAAGAATANTQLALSLDVEPGVYSTAELIQLRDAREDNDKTREAFILGGSPRGDVSDATKVKAFSVTGDFDGADARALDAFAATISGAKQVSPATVAFAQEHLATDLEDEN